MRLVWKQAHERYLIPDKAEKLKQQSLEQNWDRKLLFV